MTTITIDLLHHIMPHAGGAARDYLIPLNDAMQQWRITDSVEQAAWLANVAVESGELRRVVEGLNYSAQGLMATWPARFDAKTADLYGRTDGHPADQEQIAILAYGGRMGNAPAPSRDGWSYRGRGLIQITGRDNYIACGDALGMDLVSRPDILAQPRWAAQSAGWYWTTRGLGALARERDIRTIRRRINGGDNGLQECMAYYQSALEVLQ